MADVLGVVRDSSRLHDHPAMGQPGRVPDTRELVIPPNTVAYRVQGGIVQVLRALNGPRKWTDQF
ncbi:MAG: type II toxin-antitoxin system RelE/ParE family toxin [Candidatus Riflebacteria bacterium]|nr:type II toxin-antitoxin system RelE/ParE family toxin [Candidatus Riflebacteria bacterium]